MDMALNTLFLATLAFVGGHFLLSSTPVRRRLVRTLGQNGFLPAYSLAITGAFIWMIAAYRAAPLVPVWQPPAGLAWIPLLLMPVALFLAVAGLSTPNPTLVGAERSLSSGPAHSPAQGIISITRHPFLWGTTLWAAAHLTVNGDLANITLMGGILILSLGGMMHIDHRREESLGAAWGPVKLTTSLIPFAAILTGRAHLDWRGIGWWRPLAAIVIYMALLHLHAWVLGVSPLPV
ncbi:MAG TPA: NnrU family protein [Kiloniellales bacterium]